MILYFLEECRQEEEYINLPELVPSDLESSIVYVKSLELRLHQKEPTPDQMPYVKNMLKTCEAYKLALNFRWYEPNESIEDREIEFNIEKGLPEEWMRKVYRGVINEREGKRLDHYIQKYRDSKLSVLNLSNIFKYCHTMLKNTEI